MTLLLIGSPTKAIMKEVGGRARAAAKARTPRVAVTLAPMMGHPQGGAYMKKVLATMFPRANVERFSVEGEPDAMSARDARAVVERADVVFVSGGDPVAGAKMLVAAGAHRWLCDARARGAALVGISAGSIILGAWWGEWPDDGDDDEAKLVACTRVAARFVFDAHAEEDDWAELRVVARLARKKRPKLTYLGLPAGGAIELDDRGRYDPIGAPPFVLSDA